MGAKLTLEGTSTGAVKAVVDLQKAIEAVDKGLVSSGKSAAQLEKAAGNVVKNNEGPLEKYTRRMIDLADAVKRGKLGLEDAEKAAQKYGLQLENATKKGKEVGEATEKGFALATITKFVGGLASAEKGIDFIIEGMKEAGEAAKRTAETVVQSLGSFGELQQVSATPEEYAKNVGFARRAIRTGILPPEQKGQAADLVFALRSAGFNEQEIESLFKLGEGKYIRGSGMKDFGVGVRAYQDVWGKDAGSFDDAIKKIVQTSTNTRSNATTAAMAATVYGSPAKMAGFTDEEANAAFVAIFKESPSAEVAQVRTARLFSMIYKNKLKKGNLQETLDSLQAQMKAGKTPYKLVQNERAVAGLMALSNEEGVYQQNLGQITDAPNKALQGEGMIDTDPILKSAKLAEEAAGEAAASLEQRKAERQNLVNMVYSSRFGKGATGPMQTEKAIFKSLDSLEMDDILLRNYSIDSAATGGNSLKEEERNQIKDYFRRMADGIDKIQENQKQPTPQPHGPAE